MICDTAMFAVLAPLLPDYVDELGLTTSEAAVMTAMFSFGVIAGALPGGYVASRVGGKRTVLVAAMILAGACVCFALARSLILLDAARLLQGIAGGALWTGALTWLAAAAPPDGRATALGWLIGVATLGSLVGPPLGALGAATSVEVVFLGVALLVAALCLAMQRLPEPGGSPAGGSPARLLQRASLPRTARAIWTMLLPMCGFGVVLALGPLRLDAFGAGAAAIAAVYLIAGGAEMLTPPLAGRAVDRTGIAPLLRVARVAGALSFVLLAAAREPLLIGTLLVVAVAVASSFSVPAGVRLEEAAERAGVGTGHGFALLSLSFAGGQLLGAALTALLASDETDGLPFLVVAAGFVITLALSSATALRPVPGR